LILPDQTAPLPKPFPPPAGGHPVLGPFFFFLPLFYVLFIYYLFVLVFRAGSHQPRLALSS
jgi:hypothetical protein